MILGGDMMRKIKLFPKGSKEEEQWLNDYGKQGWKLNRVGKLSYNFEKNKNADQIMTTYTLNAVNPKQEKGHLVQEFKIKNPPITVRYYRVANQEKKSDKSKEDVVLSSKIVIAMRERVLKLQLGWALLGAILLVGMMLVLTINGTASQNDIGVLGALMGNFVFWTLFLVWVAGLVFVLRISGYCKRMDEKYRLLTQNFSGSVLDIKFITITSSDEKLNMDLAKDVGNWQLISQKNGNFQYAVRTLISDKEIKQRVKAEVPNVETVDFVKPLGFLWIP